jgi:periplasmic copper chaperone A
MFHSMFSAFLFAMCNSAFGQDKVGTLVIEAPWTRATPAGAKVAGGYVKITNTGDQPDRLTGGSLPVATKVEVHQMAMSDGVMKMRRLENGIEIGPGQTVELKPGSYHLMFTGLREGLKAGQVIKGTLVFEKAGSVEVEYRVAPIGAPKGGHMHH